MYNYFPEELDLRFLATQYIVSGRNNDIHYQKLIDDVNNAQRSVSGMAQETGDPISICGNIKKQMHVMGLETGKYFQDGAEGNQKRGSYSEAELMQLIGGRLQLSPEVCNEH